VEDVVQVTLYKTRIGHVYKLTREESATSTPFGANIAVRVRLRVKSRLTGSVVETSALVSSGFEAETSQLLLPTSLARQLSLYPPPPTASLIEVGTAGGPV
jgi:hypothetical protein